MTLIRGLKSGLIAVVIIWSLNFAVTPQVRLSDMQSSHAAALKQFLTKNKDYSFLSENALDQAYLKEMRQYFKNLKPYYNAADYNRDGYGDFAVMLNRKGKRKDNGAEMAETHRYDQPLAIVIFNGDRRGKFAKALIEAVDAPYASFINTNVVNRKRKLYFGIFQSDADTRIFTPVRNIYKVDYPETP